MQYKFFIPGHPRTYGKTAIKKEWNISIRKSALKVFDNSHKKMAVELDVEFIFDPRNKKLSASRLGDCVCETLCGIAYDKIYQIIKTSYSIRYPKDVEDIGACVTLDVSEYQYVDLPKHPCQWPGCQAKADFGKWSCREHWFLLPKPFKKEVIELYVKPMKATGKPSPEYEMVKAALGRFAAGLEKSKSE